MALLRAGNSLKRLIRSIEGSKLLEELPGWVIKKHCAREKGANRKLVRAMDLQMINLEFSSAGVPRQLLNNRWMCSMSRIWESELGKLCQKPGSIANK